MAVAQPLVQPVAQPIVNPGPTTIQIVLQLGIVIGTFLAVLVAMWSGVKARQRATEERNARDAERWDRAAGQARLVAPEWIGSDQLTVIMHNYSQSPVFYTQLVDFRWSLLPGALWHPELSLPENLPIKYALLPDKDSERPPGQRISLTGADGAQVRTAPSLRGLEDVPRMTIRFMDGSGAWWERTNHDEPVRTDRDGHTLY
jgi:hypothetical protein